MADPVEPASVVLFGAPPGSEEISRAGSACQRGVSEPVFNEVLRSFSAAIGQIRYIMPGSPQGGKSEGVFIWYPSSNRHVLAAVRSRRSTSLRPVLAALFEGKTTLLFGMVQPCSSAT
jgi:hypothetical protein